VRSHTTIAEVDMWLPLVLLCGVVHLVSGSCASAPSTPFIFDFCHRMCLFCWTAF